MVNAQDKQVYYFLNNTIIVTVPDQGNWVSVVQKAMPDPNSMPDGGNFTIIRLLVNLAVVDYNNHKTVLTSFNPPIELEVYYTDQDLKQVDRNNTALKLAYWDGSTWVVFTNAVNGYTLMPQSTGGVARLQISSWAGDPPMAWGR